MTEQINSMPGKIKGAFAVALASLLHIPEGQFDWKKETNYTLGIFFCLLTLPLHGVIYLIYKTE